MILNPAITQAHSGSTKNRVGSTHDSTDCEKSDYLIHFNHKVACKQHNKIFPLLSEMTKDLVQC